MIQVHYFHGIADPGDLLPNLWWRLMQEGLPEWMWGGGKEISLTGFIRYFSEPTRHLFLPFFTPETEAEATVEPGILGMLWVDEVAYNLRARAHLYFFKQYHRSRVIRLDKACRMVMDLLAAPPFNLRVLFFFTDERAVAVKNFARRLGVQYITTLPYYFPTSGACVGYVPLVKE